jgi:DNA-directed RNA polymerase beta' subunit
MVCWWVSGLVVCQTRLDHEAVDALIDNGIRGQRMRDSHNRPYKSFSMLLKEKKEDFVKIYLGNESSIRGV